MDWAPLTSASAALRRLNDAISARHTTSDVLDDITKAADALSERVVGEPRDKLADMSTRPHLRQLYNGEVAPLVIADGEEVEFDPFSFVGGEFHPASMRVQFFRAGDCVVGRVNLAPSFAGPPERAHGGAVAAIIDEAMGALNRVLGRRAFTASLTVDYRAPTPLGTDIEFRAFMESVAGRKIWIRCEGTGPGGLFVESRGLFISPVEDPV